MALFPVFSEISPSDVSSGHPKQVGQGEYHRQLVIVFQ